MHAGLADARRIALPGQWRPPLLSVFGFMDAGAFQPLARPLVTSIDIRIGSDEISVTIIEPDRFTQLTGRDGPAPLQNDGAYKGWRLP